MMFMMFLVLPTLCYASFFDNFTNLVTYSYIGENCTIKPAYVKVSDTVPCFPYQNIYMCCEDLMKKSNFEGPLNICYNKNGNSSFSSCYEQQLTQAETNSLGALAVFGILFFLFISLFCTYMLYSYCVDDSNSFKRYRCYKSLNK